MYNDTTLMAENPLLQRLLNLQPQLQALGEHLLADADEAEDAVQDVVVDIWCHRSRVKDITNLEGYAMNALRNRCVSLLRRRHAAVDAETLADYSDDMARQEAELTEERALMLEQMMQRLPDVQRRAVQMRYIDCLSHEEMQRRLGMSSTNVYTTISRAVSALKAMKDGR